MKELHLGQLSYMIHMNGSNYSPRGAFGAPFFIIGSRLLSLNLRL